MLAARLAAVAPPTNSPIPIDEYFITHSMSKRLQVLFDEAELPQIRSIKRHGMSVSEWVRQVVRTAQRHEAGGNPAHKLDVIRAASRHAFPIADIDTLLAEIERGYLDQRVE